MNQSVHQAPYVISHMAFEWQTMVPGHACFNPDFPAVLISQGYLCYLSLCAQLSQETIQCQCYIRP